MKREINTRQYFSTRPRILLWGEKSKKASYRWKPKKESSCWEPRTQVTVGKNLYGAANPLFQQLYFQVYKDGAKETTKYTLKGERSNSVMNFIRYF